MSLSSPWSDPFLVWLAAFLALAFPALDPSSSSYYC
eukprot:COSAG05_NODE_4948_length_1317_cov_0.930213_3_plen_35_part_01